MLRPLFERVVDAAKEASLYEYGVEVGRGDEVLTLSTCTFSAPGGEPLPVTVENGYRFVVMARLVPPEERAKSRAELARRTCLLGPDEFPSLGGSIFLGGHEYRKNSRHLAQALPARACAV